MDSLVRIQDHIYKKINKGYLNFKKSPKERVTQSYIETRLESLEKEWLTFYETNNRIMSEYDKKVFEVSEYYLKDVYSLTEELYMDYKTELKERQSILKSTGGDKKLCLDSCDCNQREIQLPKITIPSFSGNYSEWTTFRDLFVSLIHKNESFQNVQKLHYLKSYLMGEAEQLLRHIPISNENYTRCWNLLERRYNNKRFITNSIFKRFFCQRNLTSDSSNAIKELFDTTNECINALVNVGVNIENWDIILIYILSLKLDNESRKLWESKVCNSTEELPSLKQFLEFLEHRFKSLEFLIINKVVNISSLHHISANVYNDQSASCLYCSSTDHKIGNCNPFSKEDLSTRRNFVQISRLCFNCLGKFHSVKSCRIPARCKICKKKHHSQIHSNANVSTVNQGVNNQSEVINNEVSNSTTDQGKPIEETFTTCFSNNKSQVLLTTALVKAKTSTGSSVILRSLLDQGSQASFITESAVEQLGLKRIKRDSVISGVGSTTVDSKHVVYVKLQSLQDPTFTKCVECHVLSELTSFQPKGKFAVQLWPQLSRLKLADPDFNIPNRIDLVLGAEVYYQVLEEGLIKGPLGTPMAQNSKLGWILSGKVHNEHETNDISTSYNAIITMHVQVNNQGQTYFN